MKICVLLLFVVWIEGCVAQDSLVTGSTRSFSVSKGKSVEQLIENWRRFLRLFHRQSRYNSSLDSVTVQEQQGHATPQLSSSADSTLATKPPSTLKEGAAEQPLPTPLIVPQTADARYRPDRIYTGADQVGLYVPLLEGKRVGLVVNHSSVVMCSPAADTTAMTHLLDTLLASGVNVVRVFTPEHGFRGQAAPGEPVPSLVYKGIPLVSLYGKRRKPKTGDLADLDMIVYDIQDIGVRFYTYISTFQYVLEACVQEGVPLLVLDRPNPNGFYVDGPVLDTALRSFVGKQPVPIVYGMTVGEYAQMLYGEPSYVSVSRRSTRGDSPARKQFFLQILPCLHYTHLLRYVLPVPPSPNLPNMNAVYLYPSLCLLEGTSVSVGRGTKWPFQCFGSPSFRQDMPFDFTPVPTRRVRKPFLVNQKCYGVDLRTYPLDSLFQQQNGSYFTLTFLLSAYEHSGRKAEDFFIFPAFFDKLAGTRALQTQVVNGIDEINIRRTWQDELIAFKKIRRKYLLYPDFE